MAWLHHTFPKSPSFRHLIQRLLIDGHILLSLKVPLHHKQLLPSFFSGRLFCFSLTVLILQDSLVFLLVMYNFFTSSKYLVFSTAFYSVTSGSICKSSDNILSAKATAKRSQIISSLRAPKFQCSTQSRRNHHPYLLASLGGPTLTVKTIIFLEIPIALQ